VEIYSAEIKDGKASGATRLTNVNEAVMNEVDIRPAEQMWVSGSGGFEDTDLHSEAAQF